MNNLKKIDFLTSFGNDSANDWCDIIIELENGKSYSFTVETVRSIVNQMENEKKEYFFERDLLIVKKMDKRIIEEMIKEMIENDDIENYSILQE